MFDVILYETVNFCTVERFKNKQLRILNEDEGIDVKLSLFYMLHSVIFLISFYNLVVFFIFKNKISIK